MSNETVTYSLESVLKEIKDSIKEVNQKIDTMQKDVNQKIDTLQKDVSQKIDSLEKRIDERFDKVEDRLTKLEIGQADLKGDIKVLGFFGLSYAMDGVIRNETLIETDITAIFVNCLRSGAN